MTPGRAGDERRDTPAGQRLPGAAAGARLGRDREHQVAGRARGVDAAAHVAVEHQVVPDDRAVVPGRLPAADGGAGEECVRARPRRGAAGPAADPVAGAVLVRVEPDRKGRGQPRRRSALAAAAAARSERRPHLGAVGDPLGAAGAAASTSCWRARPTATVAASRTPCRSTTTATSSGPSSATPSPPSSPTCQQLSGL